MKIVVLDGYCVNPGDLSWEGLSTLGKLTVYDRTPEGDVTSRIGDAEFVLTNKTPITLATLDACPGIRYIGVLATGYNVVDTAAAKEKGIPVTNVPAYATTAVGQFAIALLLEICHHIGHHNNAVQSGRWRQSLDFCFWDYPLLELAGKTMGIIGLGRIGMSTAKIAKALDMRVIAYDRYPTDAGRSVAAYVSLDTLLGESDIISLHCPLLPETRGIICDETIHKMKDGVIIINNSRGALINEMELATALKSGKVRAAGLDVVSREPIKEDNSLLGLDNCIITPHISWASRESRQRLMDMAVENIQMFINGKLSNVING